MSNKYVDIIRLIGRKQLFLFALIPAVIAVLEVFTYIALVKCLGLLTGNSFSVFEESPFFFLVGVIVTKGILYIYYQRRSFRQIFDLKKNVSTILLRGSLRKYRGSIGLSRDDLYGVVTHDVDLTFNQGIQSFVIIVGELILLAPITAMIFILNWKGGLAVLLCGFVLYCLQTLLLGPLSRSAGDRARDASILAYRAIFQIFMGAKDILMTRSEEMFLEKYRTSTDTTARNLTQTKMNAELSRPVSELCFAVVLIAMMSTVADLPTASAFFNVGLLVLLILRLIPSASRLFWAIDSFRTTRKSIENVFSNYEKFIKEVSETSEAKSLDPKKISIRRLGFSYPEAPKDLIQDFSLEFTKGEFVCIKGRSGIGKTTLLNILTGLMQPRRGSIKADDRDITAEPLTRRCLFSIADQDPFLLDESLLNNIAFGIREKEIDLSRLDVALDLSDLRTVIDERSLNLQSLIGRSGVLLSGGERQRLSLARMFYHDAPFMILDEATTFLDSQSEMRILDRLLSLRSTKGIICVSHDPEIWRIADRVIEFGNS